MTRITCINCGIEGTLKARGRDNDSSANVFRRLGRNPFSGHQHYQCPNCEIVLLVDPRLIFEDNHIFAKKSAPYPITSAEANHALRNAGFLNQSLRQHPIP